MRIPIAKEGYIFIIPTGVLAISCWALSWNWSAVILGGLFIFVASFFRDPERDIPTDPKAMVSPADGKVVEIVTENDPFHGNPLTRISIFLSVFNVHVNRVPIHGTITKTQYNPGKFLAAFNDKASLDNEQNTIIIQNGKTEILVKQIAGLIARRILCWAREGDNFESGQRFGLIRFGSRVDIMVPQDTKLNVACGDHVSGGKSIIGFLS